MGKACARPACAQLGLHFVPAADAEHHRSLPRAQVESLVGSYVGEFLIARRLGKGGFGRVLLGLQRPLFKLRAAVKLLDFEGADDATIEMLREKFADEASALAELRHPNIVMLLGFGVVDTLPWLAMEFIPGGRTLARDIAQCAANDEGLAPEAALRIIEQVLNALGVVHGKRLIHRDLKPDNIMLEAVGGDPWHVKVVDFGLVKDTGLSHETRFVAGTIAYMAPEQLAKTALGPPTDLYAVAVILFELLTGRKVFPGNNHAVMARKADLTCDPLCDVLDVPLTEPMRAFFRRALATLPEDRFESVGAFRAGLRAALPNPRVAANFGGARDLRGLVPAHELSAARRDGGRTKLARFARLVAGSDGGASNPGTILSPTTRPQVPRKRRWLLGGAVAIAASATVLALTSPAAPTPDAPAPTPAAPRESSVAPTPTRPSPPPAPPRHATAVPAQVTSLAPTASLASGVAMITTRLDLPHTALLLGRKPRTASRTAAPHLAPPHQTGTSDDPPLPEPLHLKAVPPERTPALQPNPH